MGFVTPCITHTVSHVRLLPYFQWMGWEESIEQFVQIININFNEVD